MIVERERIRQMKLIEELGKRRMLTVVKTVDFGIYLGTSEERVLLPKKEVPKLRLEIRWKYFFTRIPATD